MERTCKKCGETKPIEEFKKHKDYKDGFSFMCKKCHNEKNKSYPIDKQKQAERIKKWRLLNQDKVKLANSKSAKKRWDNGKVKEYRILNREKLLDYKKEWRSIRGDTENKRTQKWRESNPEKLKESSKKSKLKRKNIDRHLALIWHNKNREELNDHYVIHTIACKSKIKWSIIRDHPELIEIKRVQLQIKRLLNPLKR